jgi:hypothetical protein
VAAWLPGCPTAWLPDCVSVGTAGGLLSTPARMSSLAPAGPRPEAEKRTIRPSPGFSTEAGGARPSRTAPVRDYREDAAEWAVITAQPVVGSAELTMHVFCPVAIMCGVNLKPSRAAWCLLSMFHVKRREPLCPTRGRADQVEAIPTYIGPVSSSVSRETL